MLKLSYSLKLRSLKPNDPRPEPNCSTSCNSHWTKRSLFVDSLALKLPIGMWKISKPRQYGYINKEVMQEVKKVEAQQIARKLARDDPFRGGRRSDRK